MKRIGEDLATLFAQFSSVEFLTSLLSSLSDENAPGLSEVLKVFVLLTLKLYNLINAIFRI